MAKELSGRGITVNTIAPCAIETDFGGGAVRDNAALNAQIAGTTALGRVGLPDDIGGAVAALLSEGNGWITGQRIEVSGGMVLYGRVHGRVFGFRLSESKTVVGRMRRMAHRAPGHRPVQVIHWGSRA